MDYKQDEKKPGREEFKKDVSEAVQDAVKKGRVKKVAKKFDKLAKKKKNKYADVTTKELYQMVKQKRAAILKRRGIPEKLPRGRAALISICKRIKA